jgi:hypothetical protein
MTGTRLTSGETNTKSTVDAEPMRAEANPLVSRFLVLKYLVDVAGTCNYRRKPLPTLSLRGFPETTYSLGFAKLSDRNASLTL